MWVCPFIVIGLAWEAAPLLRVAVWVLPTALLGNTKRAKNFKVFVSNACLVHNSLTVVAYVLKEALWKNETIVNSTCLDFIMHLEMSLTLVFTWAQTQV